MDYTVVKAEGDCRVQEFIHDHFMPDMPLIRAFGLDDTPPPRPSSPPKPSRDEGDFCLTAVDAQGGIVGVAVNRVSVNYEIDPDDPPQLKKMDYRLLRAETVEDQLRVDEFKRQHFLPDMPLIRAFGLEDSPLPRGPAPSRPVHHQGDFCVMATDNRGDVVGVAINRTIPTCSRAGAETPPEIKKEKACILQRHVHHLRDQINIKKSRMMEMMELLEWVEQDARLESLPERTIELRVLAVHREWRRRRVARRLAEESVRRARELGYQAIRVCCTSEYTARLVRAMGWRQHYRLRYADYPSRAGADVAVTPDPPHMYIYYYVADLTREEKDWEFVFVEDYYA